MRTFRKLAIAASLLAIPASCAEPDPEGVRFFETKIRPVLATRCFVCHAAAAPKIQAALLLDSAAGLRKGGNSGPAVEPGQPDRSLLLRALRYQDKDLKMPPGKALPPDVVADFETWIRIGAPMPPDTKAASQSDPRKRFWSFQKPLDPPVPQVANAAWARNAIDRFILAKLEAKQIAPSPEASKQVLIRRLSFDLTGLPPTAAEIDAFLRDPSPDAYAHLIDRLLASPRYGERWGRYWLDVARYSDARNVGERFPYSYTYRDWVIRALNEDMPYDRFVKLQLAADQLPENHDRRNLAALGFLSLGREFPKTFPETVDDRIDTVTRGLLGLTVACARCHDHKYDPIPTKDYYSLYSIFSNIREPRELPLLSAAARKTPLDNVWEPRLDRIRAVDAEYRVKRNAEMTAFFKTQIADYLLAVRDAAKMSNTEVEDLVKERQLNLHLLGRWRRYLKQSQASGEPVFKLWHTLALPNPNLEGAHPRIAQAFKDQPPQTIREAAALYQTVLLRDHLAIDEANSPLNLPVNEFELIFTEGDGNNTIAFGVRYDTTRALYAYAGAAPRAMAVEDLPDPKIAHVFIRGNANNPGAETPPHAPSCLSPAEPQAFEKGSGRLGLAEFIGSRDNPVTARVIVNRVWLHHFGAGIVRTPSDFGLRGDAPSHPELLDYLATRFMESGWSLKTLHRLILMSAAYRQSSMDNPASRKLDPDNQLYWRMHRQRLDIEALRDSLLAASGQLDLAPGGPPYSLTVQPAVPRRTVYGYIERGRIPGFLSNFDFASPDTHVPLRSATTVPQQALFLINSAFVTDQARALAASTSGDVGARIQAMYRSAYQRDATPQELALGLRFIASAPPEAPEPAETSAWHYGFGAPFQPFPYFTGDAWRNPGGSARIQASGGHPGDYQGDVAVLRWVSPVAGKVSTEGTLRHNQSAIPSGDGARARIVSSRHGELASWIVNGTGAETTLSGILVEKGDTLDFIVDGRADTENDSYNWAPRIRLAGTETRWDAAKDFRGPTPKPLDTWARYAQILLETNEFAFVD